MKIEYCRTRRIIYGDIVGNIKTVFVKSIANQLYAAHAEMFTADFTKNKVVVKELVDTKSKRMLNMITGYLTNLKRRGAS